MAKFVLLYSGGGMPETEEESAKVTQTWMDWFTELGDAVVDAGNPFTATSKTIGSDGTVRDGAEAMVNGYSILEAESLDEAVSMAQGCPQLESGGEVAVFETLDMMPSDEDEEMDSDEVEEEEMAETEAEM